jgi:tetratricopeptide (TPR) repeat protein
MKRFLGFILLIALAASVSADEGNDLLRRAQRTQNIDEKIALCTRVIEVTPIVRSRAGAYEERAFAFFSKRRFKEALSDADAAVALDPSEYSPWLSRAQVRPKTDCAGIMTDVAQALKLSDAAGRSVVLVTRGMERLSCGTREQAISDYRDAIEFETKDSASRLPARWMLGTLLCESGRVKEGVEWLSSAGALEPLRSETWLRRGNCLMDSGDASRARSDYDRGISRLNEKRKPALVETATVIYEEVADKNVVVKAYRRRASLKATAGDVKGALGDLQKGIEYVDEPPNSKSIDDRREIAQAYALRASLLSGEDDAFFAAEDRAAACRWYKDYCPRK